MRVNPYQAYAGRGLLGGSVRLGCQVVVVSLLLSVSCQPKDDPAPVLPLPTVEKLADAIQRGNMPVRDWRKGVRGQAAQSSDLSSQVAGLLESENPDRRYVGISMVAAHPRCRDAMPLALAALQDPSPLVRYGAIYALVCMNTDASIDALAEYILTSKDAGEITGLRTYWRGGGHFRLHDREIALRAVALRELARVCPSRRVDLFKAATQDPVWTVRHYAWIALGRSKSAEARAFIFKALKDSSSDDHKWAPLAMGHMGNTEDLPVLLAMARAETEGACFAIGMIGGPKGFEMLKELIDSGPESIQPEAVRSLVYVDDPRVVPFAREILFDHHSLPANEAAGTVLIRLEGRTHEVDDPYWGFWCVPYTISRAQG